MTNFLTYFGLIGTALVIIFSLWWTFRAPCDTVINTAVTLGQVPVRCLSELKK